MPSDFNAKLWYDPDATATTDADGVLRFRGHAGLYDLTVTHDGKTAMLEHAFPLTGPDATATLTVAQDASR